MMTGPEKAEQIKSTLRYCGNPTNLCDEGVCPYYDDCDCNYVLMLEALAYINELEAKVSQEEPNES